MLLIYTLNQISDLQISYHECDLESTSRSMLEQTQYTIQESDESEELNVQVMLQSATDDQF
jgi:hypothetical protein